MLESATEQGEARSSKMTQFAGQQPQPTTPAPGSPDYAPPSAWVGWTAFAGVLMVMIGTFHVFQGLVALFKDEYYLVGNEGLLVTVDYTGWGWTHIIAGLVVALAGFGVFAGKMWARVERTGERRVPQRLPDLVDADDRPRRRRDHGADGARLGDQGRLLIRRQWVHRRKFVH
jgi:hypothetical protein